MYTFALVDSTGFEHIESLAADNIAQALRAVRVWVAASGLNVTIKCVVWRA
jgi:hypothetical protein